MSPAEAPASRPRRALLGSGSEMWVADSHGQRQFQELISGQRGGMQGHSSGDGGSSAAVLQTLNPLVTHSMQADRSDVSLNVVAAAL